MYKCIQSCKVGSVKFLAKGVGLEGQGRRKGETWERLDILIMRS